MVRAAWSNCAINASRVTGRFSYRYGTLQRTVGCDIHNYSPRWNAAPSQDLLVIRCNPIAMKDGSPFGIAGLWENWKEPASGEWIRTFAIITTDANELIAEIHDRMPAILAPRDYLRWLSDEPDPRDPMRPFAAGPMRMWPTSTRVNKAGER